MYNKGGNQMNNMIIGVGGCASNIIKLAAESKLLNDVDMYAIDSVLSSISVDMMNRVTVIPIISDEKGGSGRNRDRGKAMYEFHEEQGAFREMYQHAIDSKAPVLVITSAAGGTGSGSTVPLCKALIERDIQVIPIIVCPNKDDPAAFHLNTNDLFIELGEVGVETYATFENRKNDANYGPINQEIVNLIEIIFGKKYDKTDLDSIDDSDLDVILSTPGRFMAISAEANSIQALQKEITRKVFSGFQPAWSQEDSKQNTIMTAYSLTSMFANTDFKTVFEEINGRLTNVYDEYRNIVNKDNDGISSASIIVAGLSRPTIKEINGEYKEANGIGTEIKKSVRPGFIHKKKASVDKSQTSDSSNNKINKFRWK